MKFPLVLVKLPALMEKSFVTVMSPLPPSNVPPLIVRFPVTDSVPVVLLNNPSVPSEKLPVDEMFPLPPVSVPSVIVSVPVIDSAPVVFVNVPPLSLNVPPGVRLNAPWLYVPPAWSNFPGVAAIPCVTVPVYPDWIWMSIPFGFTSIEQFVTLVPLKIA